MKKIRSIINFLFVLLLFNGCMQNTAFFGPAVTVASTGNIYQAGLSYGSNVAIKKITGKSTMENITEILQPKENDNKIISSAKEKIKKAGKIKDLSSQ
jgi:hypothetical protein